MAFLGRSNPHSASVKLRLEDLTDLQIEDGHRVNKHLIVYFI